MYAHSTEADFRGCLRAAIAALLLALSLTAGAASAQVGDLSGTVIDGCTDSPLAGIQLVADGPVNQTTSTNGTGQYSFPGLPAGTYSVQVDFSGYGDQAVDVVVTDGAAVVQDYTNTPGISECFIVISEDALGAGTFAAALTAANANGGTDLIRFAIAGPGVHTIRPTSALPAITDPVVIDGYSQAGSAENSNQAGIGLDAVLTIELDGSLAGAGTVGLQLDGDASVIRGLIINRFSSSAILINGGGTNIVEGNFIGTDASGGSALPNGDGVRIDAGTNNVVGGTRPSSRNLISANTTGIYIEGSAATGNVVQGNLIGTDVTGTLDIGNGYGIALDDNTTNNTIGGADYKSRNVISASTVSGIRFTAGANNNEILGNFIGTDITGTLALGNTEHGIFLNASNNTIGGTMPAAANVISANGLDGILIGQSDNVIEGNFIGTDSSGTGDLGNAAAGVGISGGTGNTIGGTDPGAGNIISGNDTSGVAIFGATTTGNSILGNLIGVDATGLAAIANGTHGVAVFDSPGNTIGGAAVASRNVISGNMGNGIEVVGSNAVGNVIIGNYIGPNINGDDVPTGLHAVDPVDGPFSNGVTIFFAPSTKIGGEAAGERNVISGNLGEGVIIGGAGATGTAVAGNYIGTKADGTAALPNLRSGIDINSAASGTLVGGMAPGAGNVISGNTRSGVFIGFGAHGQTVQGNFIGTDATGNFELGNGSDGVELRTSDNLVGGMSAAERNVISGNFAGISITDGETVATNNDIDGNYIGTNADGMGAIPNENGMDVRGAAGNRIGAGSGNVISGNNSDGVIIRDATASANLIAGNLIGTDKSGAVALGNGEAGVRIVDAPLNTLGGTSAERRNVISGNGLGIVLEAPHIATTDAKDNVIIGNYIGTSQDGSSALPNAQVGIFVSRAANNRIGGSAPGERNVISGNTFHGVIFLDESFGNLVHGNYVGTDATGTAAIPNLIGVHILGSPNNMIGGSNAGEGNVLSGNLNEGVLINGGLSTGNVVRQNLIGVAADGTTPLANLGNGVRLDKQPDYPSNTSIGGVGITHGNVIAFNNGVGVAIAGGTGNSVRGNAIYQNVGLGIDLGEFPATVNVTENDAGDSDVGANDFQNFPVLSSITFSAGDPTVGGTLQSQPNTAFDIEVFANVRCDLSGHGEGQVLLGAVAVTTDGAGNASFEETFSDSPPDARLISATATDPAGNTSEFSVCTAPDIIVPEGHVFDIFTAGLLDPQGLALDDAGNLFVAATGSGEVLRIAPDGSPSVVATGFSRPIDVALNGTTLYVTDLDLNSIFAIDLSGALPLASPWTSTVVTGLDGPTHLRFGPDGRLYVSVARGDDDRVLAVDTDTKALSLHIDFPGTPDPNPQGLVFETDGTLHFAAQFTGEVRTAAAGSLPPIDGNALPLTLTGLNSPGGIDLGVDDHLYVATADEIARQKGLGTTWAPFVRGLSGDQFNNLLFAPNGHLYVADRAAGRIIRVVAPQQQQLTGGTLEFHINATGHPSITDGSDLQAVQNAFQHWEDVTSSTVAFDYGGTTPASKASAVDGINLVTFTDTDFLVGPNVLAVVAKTIAFGDNPDTAEILDVDIVYNPQFVTTTEPRIGTESLPGMFDIEAVATHEVGHILGLVHSGVPQATMFFIQYPNSLGRRTLELDDRAWVSYRYPEPGFDTGFGAIEGRVYDGESPSDPIAGALIIAVNAAGEGVHAYTDLDGYYHIPGLPAGDYKVLARPLDGKVFGTNMGPGHVSAYLETITTRTDWPGEWYNEPNESKDPDVDNPEEFSLVTVNSVAGEIDIITNIDKTPPAITAISPADAATGVLIKAEIVVGFSEPVNTSSVESAFSLTRSGVPVDGSFDFINGDKTVLFTPTTPLLYGAVYDVGVASTVEDRKGNLMLAAFSSSFGTEAPDASAPSVTEVVPAPGAGGVYPTSNVTIVFSEPIDPATLAGNLALSSSSIPNIAGVITPSLDNSVATFDPTSSLSENTQYTLTLTSGIEDVQGNALVPFSSTFTTVVSAVPSVVFAGPQGSGVTVSTPILVDFSEPIDRTTVTPASFAFSGPSGILDGTFEYLYDDSRVVFTPETVLEFSTPYAYTLSTAIADVSTSPQTLAAPFTGSFTTSNAPQAPSITSVSPPSAAEGHVVTINGAGFSPIPADNAVSFNGIPAIVSKADLTSLTTGVPNGASTGPLTVTVGGETTNAFQFGVVEAGAVDNTAIARLSADSGTRDADITPDGNTAYVTNSGANSVTVIDLLATTVVAPSIPVGDTPLKIAINAEGTLAYVTNFWSHSVSVIDLSTKTVVASIPVGLNPIGVAVTPDGNTVYVAEFTSQGISVIDTEPTSGAYNRVISRLSADSGQRDVEISPDGNLAVVTGTVEVVFIDIDPQSPGYNSVISRLSADSGTRDAEISPDGSYVVVTTGDGGLLVIDIRPESDTAYEEVARLSADSGSREVEISPDGTHVYVTNYEAGTVSVYQIVFGPAEAEGVTPSGLTAVEMRLDLVDTILVGDNPEGIVINPTRGIAVVANSGSDDVSVIVLKGATPGASIEGLLDNLNGMIASGLVPSGQGAALVAKINQALNDLTKGKADKAREKLEQFIGLVESFVDNGKIAPDVGENLIREAQRIIDKLDVGAGKGAGVNEPEDLPKEFRFAQNYPNPFSAQTVIAFELPGDGQIGVEIEIFDILGRHVRTLVNHEMPPGRYSVAWDGSNADGSPAASGLYLCRIRSGEFEQVRKMVLVR